MKKLVSLMIVFCMMIPLSIPVGKAAYAVEKDLPTIEVINNSKYVSDSQVERLKEGVKAEYTAPNGEVIPLDCTVTIEDIECDIMSRQSGARSYAVTVSATKDESNIGNLNGKNIVATASVTMTWTDVPGIKNTLDSLSGYITLKKGTVSNAICYYGNVHTHHRGLQQLGTAETWAFDVGMTSTSLSGKLHACYKTWFNEASSTDPLVICVEPTIFD